MLAGRRGRASIFSRLSVAITIFARDFGTRLAPGKARRSGRESTFFENRRGSTTSPLPETLDDALEWINRRQHEDCAAAYGNLLRRCGDLTEGRKIHDHVVNHGYYENVFVGNHLIQMYARCGSLEDAKSVFDRMRRRDSLSWSKMIAAYSRSGFHGEAIELYRSMSIDPDGFAFSAVLQACANLGGVRGLAAGREIHAHTQRIWFKPDVFVDSALVTMYARCGSIAESRAVFDDSCRRWKDSLLWNSMIAGYLHAGMPRDAIELYRAMRAAAVAPNAITYATALAACSSAEDLAQGRAIHREMRGAAADAIDAAAENSLVNMYAKCGSLAEARAVFDSMRHRRSVVSWTGLISGYVREGAHRAALDLFHAMESEGVAPNGITYACVLRACSSLDEVRAIHSRMRRAGHKPDAVVENVLVDVYGRYGATGEARAVFDSMPRRRRDAVTWTAMIAAYVAARRDAAALELYRVMDVAPTGVTVACAVRACAGLGNGAEGARIAAEAGAAGAEDEIVQSALLAMYAKCGMARDARRVFDAMPPPRSAVAWSALVSAYVQDGGASVEVARSLRAEVEAAGFRADAVVRTALVNLFAKCGSLDDARQLFDGIHRRDAVSWSTLVAAYTQHGRGRDAVELFRAMELQGLEITGFVYGTVLTACCQAGMVESARHYFVCLTRDLGVAAKPEDYVCVVGALARTGRLRDAEELLETMPFEADAGAWMSLLAACKTHNDVERGARVAEVVLELEPLNQAAYVMLANVYVAAGRHEEAGRVRKKMGDVIAAAAAAARGVALQQQDQDQQRQEILLIER